MRPYLLLNFRKGSALIVVHFSSFVSQVRNIPNERDPTTNNNNNKQLHWANVSHTIIFSKVKNITAFVCSGWEYEIRVRPFSSFTGLIMVTVGP